MGSATVGSKRVVVPFRSAKKELRSWETLPSSEALIELDDMDVHTRVKAGSFDVYTGMKDGVEVTLILSVSGDSVINESIVISKSIAKIS